MKDLIQTVNSALGRRAAGLPISELSSQVGWPSFSALAGKKSLLKTLTQFPSHFRIYNVEGTLVVQQVIPGATSCITTDEVCAWLAGAEGEFSQQRASSPAVHAINREVDLVVRAVTFLRKQWLRRRAVTFAELSTVISPHRKDSEETNCDQFLLSILYRYDVVMGINSVGDNYFITSEDQKVQLSLREEQALRALEAFRTTCMTTEELHKEAIQPFLMCCRKAVPETAAVLPIALLERWLQVERLSLEHEELARMISVSGGPYRVDEETCNIHLVDCIETEKTLDSPDVPFISSPKCPLTAGSISSDHFTFDSQLLRVLRAQHPDGLLHFVRNVVHAVFDVLLPHVSIPSGITFRKLQPRVRWGPLAVTLGSLISFVDAFDGLFFDVVRVASMSGGADTGDDAVFSVSAYQGPLGPHLLYARLIARLFPVDVDFPLGLMAESLSWGRWFAPMFGDLVSFLRSVGRQCRNGHLLARKGAAMTGCHNNSDIRLWELLVMVREAVSQHSLSNDSGGSAEYAILSSEELKNLLPNKMAANQGDRSLSDNKCDWNMVLAAARRFPLFFQLCDVEDDAPHRVRVAMPNAVLTEGTVRFVEEYVCPLLRQHRRATITELDERLGWSRGSFDDHPTGMRVTGYRASDCSLYGVLKRYVEGCQQPHIILVEQTPILPQLHDNIHVMPNDAAYMSPEDMLLEVNGLRPVCVEEGCFQLRPVGRPVSLFELVSEESELQAFPSTDGVMLTAREEKWPVMLTCESDEPDDWVRELSNGTGDILVWCGEGSCDR
uniref:WGS project CAEQ00000000 data, annotated contig 798 n=1 Tax=Trypanosoma congolense (strain IL3000) TaxID=1068625 RepID=F9WII4_TRYCI|nr:unnamed protein product [Trypanosoma congolense IL3000]